MSGSNMAAKNSESNGGGTESMETRAPRGRPRLDPDKVRSERVVTFVTQREMQAIKAIGGEHNLSMSAVCYRLLSHALAKKNN